VRSPGRRPRAAGADGGTYPRCSSARPAAEAEEVASHRSHTLWRSNRTAEGIGAAASWRSARWRAVTTSTQGSAAGEARPEGARPRDVWAEACEIGMSQTHAGPGRRDPSRSHARAGAPDGVPAEVGDGRARDDLRATPRGHVTAAMNRPCGTERRTSTVRGTDACGEHGPHRAPARPGPDRRATRRDPCARNHGTCSRPIRPAHVHVVQHHAEASARTDARRRIALGRVTAGPPVAAPTPWSRGARIRESLTPISGGVSNTMGKALAEHLDELADAPTPSTRPD
jgi:hypothetical protein